MLLQPHPGQVPRPLITSLSSFPGEQSEVGEKQATEGGMNLIIQRRGVVERPRGGPEADCSETTHH